MLQGLLDTIEQLQNFSFVEEVRKLVYVEDEEILNLLRGQLSIGKTGSDSPITWKGNEEYRPATIRVKERFGVGLGEETRWITLYMTGAFYASLYIIYNENGGFSVSSDDWKYEKIVANTTEDTLLLNKINSQHIQEQIGYFLQQEFDKTIT